MIPRILLVAVLILSFKSNIYAQNSGKSDYNILFVADFSNRLRNSSTHHIKDQQILDSVLSLFYPKIHRNYSRSVNQKDVFRFVFTNNNLSNTYNFPLRNSVISFQEYKLENSQAKNIFLGNTIQNRNSYTECEFTKSKKYISKKFDSICRIILRGGPCYGADIYGFLNHLNEPVLKSKTSGYINYIVLLTDGYIENTGGVDNHPLSKDLSTKKINDFRNNFLRSSNGVSVDIFFNSQNQFGITTLSNRNLINSNTKILVMQIDNRGSGPGRICNVDPCDDEIIKLFWRRWLVSSGFKNENIILMSKDDITNSTDLMQVLKNFFSLRN